ncbi:aldose 1-epimerase [Tamlana fucoidanivorans]|uniref:Aldose 1-epimerase n=1 Tax=Allotamlana fucoidanivorans TaxID=2583814 RepID=A0A5C4SH64_9FLAO|nr:aldose 1-epimerase [Tamlana fucoidanivorans]TNJ42989.1 aldose 1-epimerase [Tamlana fucoidanivorans]
MYHIKHNKNSNTLEIEETENNLYSKIYLDLGASLQELTLGSHAIIQDLTPLHYDDTYASSILFPFANRIKDGKYEFEGEKYQFNPNQVEEHNALHGLVYNKTFQIIEQEASQENAKIVLEYIESQISVGFPFTYKIQLTYLFAKTSLDLKVEVLNTSDKTFPFTLGWHPYFISDDLFNSSISFSSSKRIVLGDRNITTGTEELVDFKGLKIENKQLDDCWELDNQKATFNTPKYRLELSATGNNNFLQSYTPPRKNTIAIEPTTGVSDSFNNNIGLQTLNSGESYSITWGLKIYNN